MTLYTLLTWDAQDGRSEEIDLLGLWERRSDAADWARDCLDPQATRWRVVPINGRGDLPEEDDE